MPTNENRLKILILGADGMLGSALVKALDGEYRVVKSIEKELDITDKGAVERLIVSIKPSLVINAAGYTDVDGCETNREKAFAVNAGGVENIATGCRKASAKLIHFSTDYIFDGTKEEPYTEEDTPNPINVYGESKLEGEMRLKKELKEHYIIRTQWLYGPNGKNFVDAILNLLKEKEEIRVVNDQVGSPTYSVDLAQAVKRLIEKEIPFGIYNIANSGYCSWYEFARQIAAAIGNKRTSIISVKSEAFPRPGKRPKNSMLIASKMEYCLGSQLKKWKESLHDYLRNSGLVIREM